MMQKKKRFGKNTGIENLTFMLVAGYAIGYILELVNPNVLGYLTLDPYQILHGQVWRVITWLLVPPGSFDIFTLLMLYFYYRIGTLLEQIWGKGRYTRYILGGIILTVIAAFLMYGYLKYFVGMNEVSLAYSSAVGSLVAFSTYYINLSIFMGYAATLPDMMVLFFFVIPIKIKVLGIIDLLLLVYMFFTGSVYEKFAIAAALLNIGIFLLTNKVTINPRQLLRRQRHRQRMQQAQKMTPTHRHICTICGRTDEHNTEIEFRYCSKCNGNYEYCSKHLFTHEHIK